MADIYASAFRTVLNDCSKSAKDVINEIAKKYRHVVKGMGKIMGGALLETNALNLLSSGIPEKEAQRLAEIDDDLVEKALKLREA